MKLISFFAVGCALAFLLSDVKGVVAQFRPTLLEVDEEKFFVSQGLAEKMEQVDDIGKLDVLIDWLYDNAPKKRGQVLSIEYLYASQSVTVLEREVHRPLIDEENAASGVLVTVMRVPIDSPESLISIRSVLVSSDDKKKSQVQIFSRIFNLIDKKWNEKLMTENSGKTAEVK